MSWLKQWTFNLQWDKKDRACSSHGNMKHIPKCSCDKGNEIWAEQTQMITSVPGKSSGTWLWHRSPQGHCEEELKKKVTAKAIHVPAGKEIPAPVPTCPVAVCSAGPWAVFWCLWAFPHSLGVCSGRHPDLLCFPGNFFSPVRTKKAA